ncbi:MAG: aspartate--tRNA ligase, partial [Clostridia bacterium]
FIQIRDRSGISQVIFDTNACDKAVFDTATSLKLEYVITVIGKVRRRVGDNVNSNMATGEIEIVAESLKILSEAETTPFSVGDTSANELLRLKYRYLDLRREDLQRNLIMRSKVCNIVRNYLADIGFLEIETPFLGRSTPEGARDYLVPSRLHHGSYYALPQSPQLYKQLLMIGGLDKYFQIARCFRDEDLRANRQPEFTQIDLEMSFIDQEKDLMTIMEGLIQKIFKEIKGLTISAPFQAITWNDAMSRFGSDKPDLRFAMEIQNISDLVVECGFPVFEGAVNAGGSVRAVVLKGEEEQLSRKEIDKLTELVKTYKAKGLAWYGISKDGAVRTSFGKYASEELMSKICERVDATKGDMIFIVADSVNATVELSLGALRCSLASRFGLIDNNKYAILWVVDFPLFEYNEEEHRFMAMHHPFTSPKTEDLPYILSDPARCKAKAYDLVINGDEMGGGSMRIYNSDVQKLMFEAIGLSDEQIKNKFGFFVEAFKYGTPPHGGLAFGLDRLMMKLIGTDNIKDVIAFPKLQNASCLMSDAPNSVDDKQLSELAIKNLDKEQKD